MVNFFLLFSSLRFPCFYSFVNFFLVLSSVLVDDFNNEIAQGLMREISDELKNNSDGTKQETVLYFFSLNSL